MHEHTVKAFESELRGLDRLVEEMGQRASAQLHAAIEAARARDVAQAVQVVEDDAEVDALERRVQEAAVKLLALRQPLADDLREVVTAIKISSDLERIGDLAKKLARRVEGLSRWPEIEPWQCFERMSAAVIGMLDEVVRAYVERDAGRGLEVWRADQQVDDRYDGLFQELLTTMMQDGRTIGISMHLLFMAKNVERIGDHCTNIAEALHFLVTGRSLAEPRPKGAVSRYGVAPPGA